MGVPYGIATSGRRPEIDASLDALGIGDDVVVVERGEVMRAKPEPDLFLACQERMGVEIRDVTVVGDAVWDLLAARRAGMLSVGLLTGGYGEDELTQAGAFRVYRDPAELDAVARRAGHRPSTRRVRPVPPPGAYSDSTAQPEPTARRARRAPHDPPPRASSQLHALPTHPLVAGADRAQVVVDIGRREADLGQGHGPLGGCMLRRAMPMAIRMAAASSSWPATGMKPGTRSMGETR